MRRLTASTVTDAQIIALGEDPRVSLQTKAWCIAAMRIVYGASEKQLAARKEARAVVAKMINERATEETP